MDVRKWKVVGVASFILVYAAPLVQMFGSDTMPAALFALNYFVIYMSVAAAEDMANYSLPSLLYIFILTTEMFFADYDYKYILASILMFSLGVYLHEISEKRINAKETES